MLAVLLSVLEFAIGLVLAMATLRDVFGTVVVPGRSRARLQVARRLVRLGLPIATRIRGAGRGISTGFAPLILSLTFVIWMVLLMCAFGLMAHALRGSFEPRIESLPQALYIVGSGLVTIGLSQTEAIGAARWLMLVAGFCGLAVMTMAVTYLLEVQDAIARRDAGILKLGTTAGRPPSGAGLLERYAALGCRDEVPGLLRDARDWCAAVLQSHASHPSLIYFRSVAAETGWPAALGAVLDAAALIETLVDHPAGRGIAVLLHDEGMAMAEQLARVVGLAPVPTRSDRAEIERVRVRLLAAGYRVRGETAVERFIERRAEYAGLVSALADHLASPRAVLVPAPDGSADPPCSQGGNSAEPPP